MIYPQGCINSDDFFKFFPAISEDLGHFYHWHQLRLYHHQHLLLPARLASEQMAPVLLPPLELRDCSSSLATESPPVVLPHPLHLLPTEWWLTISHGHRPKQTALLSLVGPAESSKWIPWNLSVVVHSAGTLKRVRPTFSVTYLESGG